MNKKAVILFFPNGHPEGYDYSYPWALLYLERMVRHLDVELILLDERINKDYTSVIQEVGDRLLFAGVSAVIGYQVVGGVRFSEKVKSLCGAPVIWGGWFVTVCPEMLLNDGYADYICVGQGEQPFKTFTERMIASEGISDIPGIGYKENENIVVNPNNVFVDPASFPAIDRTIIDLNKLLDNKEKDKPRSRIFNYLASTGCPYNCGFCSVNEVFGSKWFVKKVPEIIDDLKYFTETANISQVIFLDDTFFASKKFVREFCNEKIKSGLSFLWTAQATVDYFLRNFSDDDIQLIYQSGCRRIVVGAESGDQETLDLINKKIQVKDNLALLKLLKKHNIQTRLHTMVCLPLNPEKDFKQTLNLIGRSILIDPRVEVNIRFYKPIPKTTLYRYSVDKGFIQPSTTKEMMSSFFNKNIEPWYKMDYHKRLDYFVNFYFLFLNPFYFMNFPLRKRPFVFILNLIIYPITYIRIKLNWMGFPIEARVFRRFFRAGKLINFIDPASFNKTKIYKTIE
jgi:anaerobic magnesium-protoporphyrin IX monomethyl ester cyclase